MSYSVSLTTTATLLSPVVVSMVLYLTVNQTGSGCRRPRQASLLGAAPASLFAGGPRAFLVAKTFRAFEHVTNRFAGVIANLVILWIIAVVVNANHANLSQTLSGGYSQLVLVLMAINIWGYGGGWLEIGL